MSITYEQIKAANDTIVATPIKGKDYAEVSQRIKAFRMVYPMGFILPTMTSNENGVCVFKASVGYYDENGNPIVLGAGTAYEKEGSTFINKTSYIENCETSAVGRALGMAGFGNDISVASAEEVQNAIENQDTEETPKASPNQINLINKLVSDIPAMLAYYKVNQIQDLTAQQASEIITKKMKAKKTENTSEAEAATNESEGAK